MAITLSEFLTILAFKISKKLNNGLKIGILKMLFKILLALHTVLRLKYDGITIPKLPIKKKMHFRGQILGQGQI